MGNIARIASGAPTKPFANINTTKAIEAFASVQTALKTFFQANTHLVLQVGLFLSVIAALSAHLTTTQVNSQQITAAQAGLNAPVIDELSSSEVAAVVAITTDALLAEEVVAMAEKVDAGESVAATSEDFLSKPAVAVTDDASETAVRAHTVAAGENLDSIAAHYGVSKETIIWSNNLQNETVAEGTALNIPSVSGVLYTVAAGDTPASIAAKFSASEQKIVTFNDAEISGLAAGQKIVVPGGTVPAPAPAPVVRTTNSRVSAAAAVASANIPASGSSNNSYYFGYCTWGVANLIGVPKFWGNANRWDDSARAAGIAVNNTPAVGAIAQTDAGYGGHVGLVIGVSGDQVLTRDMNGNAGWGRYGDAWHPVSQYRYIHMP